MTLKSILKMALQGATVLLLGAGLAGAQQQINLTAAPTTATMPDGSTVPMWGYSCGAAVSGSTAACAAANGLTSGTNLWSPVVITVPTGQALTINLTNSLSFSNGNSVPTSIVIVGQIGGGLGTPTAGPAISHQAQGVTWPTANTGPMFNPPVQGSRVRSFGTEVGAGATTALTWNSLKPGTYLLESGTHPSIQVSMGLYGVLVVTAAPTAAAGVETAPGTAYPANAALGTAAVTYDAEVPFVFGEIDPIQNTTVSAAVNTAGFSEATVWSGQPGGCGNPGTASTPNAAYLTCYPPAVNYTPTYYTINGVPFNKNNTSGSLFPITPATLAPASGTGSVLVRMVNAGSRMHVPSIVGSQVLGQTGGAQQPIVTGFQVIAEDGNPLPGVPKVKSEVFMAAGKVYDVMINGQATTGSGTSATIAPYANALAIYDRELSLSGNKTSRDSGMLAYIGINGAQPPVASNTSAAPTPAAANPDKYILTPGQILTVSDPGKGVIANDFGVYLVQVLTQPTNGTVSLNPNGTFVYYPATGSTATTDSFTYCANTNVTGTSSCPANLQATVTLAPTTVADKGITCSAPPAYTSTMATYLAIKTPGVLAYCKDASNLPISLSTAAGATATSAGLTVQTDANGGFTAVATAAGTYTATFTVQDTEPQSTPVTVKATIVFPTGSGLAVNVLDGYDKVTPITDYRWVIEEDKTFYNNPACASNGTGTLPVNCPQNAGTALTLGINFHTSYMPFVAQGCTGPKSCEGGQTVVDPATGIHSNAVCDVGNGVCRPDTTGNGLTAVFPGQVALDPTKRYYISILPGDAANPFNAGYQGAGCQNGSAAASSGATCGHGMGGAPIAAGQTSVTVLTQPSPYPPGLLSVFVFEDDFPLNGEQDGGGGVDVLSPDEPGLGGFQIHLWDAMGGNGDFTGQMTYDMFNQPLTNSLAGTIDPSTGYDACPVGAAPAGTSPSSTANELVGGTGTSDPTATGITGMIVTCPKYERDGVTLSPLAGQALVANLMPGRWGVIATPGADRIARGEEWLQTNTLDGQKAHDVFTRIGEPSYFQEFGPASYHVTIGFANPAIINARHPYVCNGTDPNITGLNCNNTIIGKVTGEHLSRTPDERLFDTGSHDTYYWSQCYVSFGDPDGEDFAFTKCNSDGTFKLSGLPDGDWRVTVFDQWNDLLVDGLSTPIGLSQGLTGGTTNMGDIASTQWETDLYTRTFIDDNVDGISQSTENGIPFANVAVRLRDGSLENLLQTDFNGTANFNETFPLFSWYVVETDVTRYKNTGTHVVYDVGGPVDGTCTISTTNGLSQNSASGNPPCGTSTIAKNLANTAEVNSVPVNLRVPGSVYCAVADCSGKSIQNATVTDPPSVCTTTTPTDGSAPVTTCSTQLSSGRIDNPWHGGNEGWQGFPGQNSFLEFGKAPYVAGENGGIKGHVIYASTRPFDDPMMLVQTQWEPLVPHVTMNLYQEGVASDGITPTLTLVDTTKTTSWDDWAQGFRTDGFPNMNCPGQSTADLFFFSLYNQPNYLNFYDSVHGGPAIATLPDNSQYKCYDGMHNWNQIQPAPYDGQYQFPSVTSLDPVTGKPAGTNCAICTTDPATDLYSGIPMLPTGKYVVEVVLPPGYELVKEEDKNILIGDNFIAPVTQEFGSLSNVFIIPDQASVSSQGYPGPGYNANNAQNPTNSLGATPQTGLVPGFTPEPLWPCVGEMRVVPDYISLFPQSKQVAPFAGATRPLCDRKEVTLNDQMGAIAKFYIYTSTHIAAKFTGGITDDYTSEFDPFSPQFGEKFAPPNLPVAIKDWAGNETNRVYADNWGAYDGMTYSTWEVNPPNPTGYSPTMMVMCMNDAGPIPGPNGTTITDPAYTPGYSQFCYELPFMPGTTEYLDTPVVPTSAFAGAGYNNVDCAYPALTPAVSEVDGDGLGPWVGGVKGAVTTLTLTNGGSGYTAAPTVGFTGSGTGATATAVISGYVSTVAVGNGGRGYASAPAITFTGGGGSGAVATATMTGSVTSVTIPTGGTGSFASNPTVRFSAPATGTMATGTVQTASAGNGRRKITGITITNAGTGYTGTATLTFSVSSTSTLSYTVNMGESVLSVAVTSGGSGYATPPTVSFAAAPTGGATASGTATDVSSVVAIALTTPGTGYTTAPTVSFTGGGGSGASATATIEANGTLTITALGDQVVPNYAYSGPAATTAPFNTKTITRHYGFGATQGTGSVTIGGKTATVTSWSDNSITVTVPSGVPACAVQQQAQYGGSTAQCGELVVTAGNGKQSVDAVTVTIGGKAPTHVAASASIQSAIDAALPGDLLIVDPTGPPTCTTTTAGVTSTVACSTAGSAVHSSNSTHSELLLMWKPVRLQGVGAASSIIDANTHPAGKLTAWRERIDCLFGLTLQGTPPTATSGVGSYDPSGQVSCPATGWNMFVGNNTNAQVDPLPFEAIVGWDATQNGNLAQLLQEPSLMGALEGAGITVLGKGVNFPTPLNVPGAAGAFPTGTTLLTGPVSLSGTTTVGDANPLCHTSASSTTNPFPSNFMCNPSSIDGLGITDASQGGGGIYVHAWAHNLQIANDRINGNAGTLSGGINLGQGEFAPAYIAGGTTNSLPGSCINSGITTNTVQPYCQNINVNIHNNNISLNSSTGDELFSGTPAGAGGVSICTGADFYKFNYNWICGNLSSGDGGGVGHMGLSYNGDIEHNSILFNQSLNPTIPANGGGLLVMGTPDIDPTCGSTTDADCVPLPSSVSPSDGIGPNLVINANLIMGNAAESGSGGGLRLQQVNGTDILSFPTSPSNWWSPSITNNIIADNVAGWDGAGISLVDALNTNIINNTVVSNSTTASAGILFTTIGAPIASSSGTNAQGCTIGVESSCPQVAGLVAIQHGAVLAANLPATITCPAGHYQGTTASNATCRNFSYPLLANNVFWQNSAYYIGVGALSPQYQQSVVSLYNAFTTTMAPTQPQAITTAENGPGSVTITGGTGACLAASYWDIGVRGDLTVTGHESGVTLAPTYSVITNITGYSTTNKATGPNFTSQYCNGSRTPPEFGQSGWAVPAGISDATVPNPIFNLTPVATVDEGNNWINLRWGPLSLLNPVNGNQLGIYTPTATSSTIGVIPSGTPAYTEAPLADFFGVTRRNGTSPLDAGAVEYQRPSIAVVGVAPASLTFTAVDGGAASAAQALTVTNDGGANFTGLTVTVTAPFSRPTGAAGGTCGATLAPGSCTINVVYTATALGTQTGSVTIAGSVPVTGSPVSLSGTGTAATPAALVSSNTLAFGSWATGTTSNALALTVTNVGNVPLAGGTFTISGATQFTRVTSGTFPTGAPNCAAALATGASCTIKVALAVPTGLKVSTPYNGTLTVAYPAVGGTNTTVTNSPVALSGTGVATKAPALTITATSLTLPAGTLAGTITVTATNSAAAGGSDVAITADSVSGAGVTIAPLATWAFTKGTTDSCLGTNLAPGASCTVSVNFTRLGTTGTRTGTITFTGTQTGSPQSATFTATGN